MSSRRILLAPFLWSARNRFFPAGAFPYKTIGVALFGLAIVVALYLISYRVTLYFHSQSELGIILSLKIFQMAWIVLFAMLVFSCMVSSVSTVFLSQDNEIVAAAPVSPAEIYGMRFFSTSVYTSWMMVVFSFPVFAAYGHVFHAHFLYWPLLMLTILALAATATCFGMLLVIVLVNLFPARRTKDIVLYLSLCFGVFIYVMFRIIQPEELVNPEKYGHFIEYLSSISSPAGPYVPAAWAANFLSTYLLDRQVDWLLFGLILVSPFSLFFLGEWAMECFFFAGYTKSQESFGGYRRFAGSVRHRSRWQWILSKELKTLFRDSAEWSQLFMVGALVMVYLYNFTLLPVDRSPFAKEYITNLISFLNVGLAGFMVASLAARFAYPSVGAEGGAFYLIQSAPISMRRYLFTKYLMYVVPFTVLSLVLVVVSDHLLQIEGPMWWFSVVTSTIITWTVVAMAVGFGALYADFKAENRAAALGGMGAILFLLTSLAYELCVIFLGSLPAYRIVKKWLKGSGFMKNDLYLLAGWVLAVLALSFFLAFFFFRKGVRHLEDLE